MAKTQGEKMKYVNPVNCLNYEGGHYYEHKLRVNISSSTVDPITGEMIGEVEKEYILELVCRDCSDRKRLYSKTVGMSETVSLAQMLEEYRTKLAEAHYAKLEQSSAPSTGGR